MADALGERATKKDVRCCVFVVDERDGWVQEFKNRLPLSLVLSGNDFRDFISTANLVVIRSPSFRSRSHPPHPLHVRTFARSFTHKATLNPTGFREI